MAHLPAVRLTAWAVNPRAQCSGAYPEELRAVLSHETSKTALEEIRTWPGYAPTPLYQVNGLAKTTGLDAVYYKDEAQRFDLASFKALGGAYAVLQVLKQRVQDATGVDRVSSQELMEGRYREKTRDVTVTCATDGNHGRSVAWGAQMFGCNCVIFIHQTVSDKRKSEIERFGADVVRVSGNYDNSVRRADAEAHRNGWTIVSDTSYKGYMDIPRDVMRGYTVMAEEILGQLPAERNPTHVFVQGGVGGFAAALCAHFWQAWGTRRPGFVVVEPTAADCIYRSVGAGRPTPAEGNLETVMAGLSCGEVSQLAWQILSVGADAVATVSDEPVPDCMRLLARGVENDSRIVAGESAVAGLIGVLGVLQDSSAARDIGLDHTSRVLLIGSEGATDPDIYRTVVGRSAEAVLAAT